MVRYGLIGYPLGHSFSAQYFTEKFAAEAIDAEYRLYPIRSAGDMTDFLKNNHLAGFNVTIPYKESIIEYLDELSEDAREIGAVNTVKKIFTSHSKPILKGYNTDWLGFRESLRHNLTSGMKKALVLGTGGASKAVVYALRTMGISSLLVSRQPACSPAQPTVGYNDINEMIMAEHLLIVNTTPLGMWPDTETSPSLPYHLLTPAHLCYDLVYNPSQTKFMKECAHNGARVCNGLDMLHRQAEQAWSIWNSKES